MKKSIDYWLLWKSLNDSLTDEENKELELWLRADIKHKDHYDKLKNRYKQNISDPFFDVNSKEIWEKITLPSKQKYNPLIRFAGIAASILLVLASVYFIWNAQLRYKHPVSVENISVVPGVKKATLVLNNGYKFELDTGKDTLICNADVVIKNSNGSLNYKATDTKPQKNKFNTLIVPRGGEYYLELSDGTKVWVNSETVIRYPEVFEKNERHIELIGEAYFEVKTDSLCPFIITSGEHVVKVFGTSFDLKSYADENVITTSLVEGHVQVMVKTEKPTIYNLEPGTQSVFTKETLNFKLQKVNMQQYISWKDGHFYFRKMQLVEMLKVLGRWYDIDFIFKNPEAKTIQFNGNLKRYDNIQPILSQLSKTNEITFYAYGKNIYVN